MILITRYKIKIWSQSCQTLISSFFRFSLLSLSVYSIRKYSLCFKMAKLNSKKMEKKSSFYKEKSLVRLTQGLWFLDVNQSYLTFFDRNNINLTKNNLSRGFLTLLSMFYFWCINQNIVFYRHVLDVLARGGQKWPIKNSDCHKWSFNLWPQFSPLLYLSLKIDEGWGDRLFSAK
jgi:hypothetical protein